MIQALWIITENGQSIFSHKYIDLDIDDQLISGLLTAFDAFSTESGIGGVQQIGGEDNQFIYGSSGKLLVAALADKRDNPELVERLMVKIADLFQEKYKQYLNDLSFVDLNVFNGFENDIDSILLKKVYKRGASSTIFGIFVSFAITAGVFLMMLNTGLLEEAIFLMFLIFVPGLFIGSLIAGKNTYGLIAALTTVTPIIGYYGYIIISNEISTIQDILSGAISSITLNEVITQLISDVFLMAITYITIATLFGILGGGFIDKRRLFPLVKEEETKIEVFPENTVVTPPQLGQVPPVQESSYQQETISDEPPAPTEYYTDTQTDNSDWS